MLKLNTLYRGDCLKGLKHIKDGSVDLILTDPPYEVNYNDKSAHLSKLRKAGYKQLVRDASFIDTVPSYEALSEEYYRVLKDESHCYLFCCDRQIRYWHEAMEKAGFKNPQVLVWKKENCTFDMTMGYKFPENKEFILFFHKGWKKLNGYNIERGRFRSCLTFKASADTRFHSCAKPIDLLQFLIKLSSKEGEVVLDTFMGSGQTALAARALKRNWVGFELSTDYCKTINKRLNQGELDQWLQK